MPRRWGEFLVLIHFIFGPGRKRLAHSCICVCLYVCLCLCGYLHMRVTAYDLLTETAHRLHVRLHVKHMHSFRGSTHRLL